MSRWVIVIGLSLVPAMSWAAPLTVETRPRQVTVFPGGALVTREARVQAPTGNLQVVLTGFPARMRDPSVRIRLGGTGRPHLVGFAVKQIPVEKTVSPEARKLEEELEQLKDQDRTMRDQISVLRDRLVFIRSLAETYQKRVTANMALSPIDTASWRAVYSFGAARLEGLGTTIQQVGDQRKKLARKISFVRRQLAKVSSKRAKQTKSVAVDLRVAAAGPVRVAVRYLVPRARWRSVYDAYLEGERIRFVHYGIVSQRTGEDWSDVKLVLSSASVAQSVSVPKLSAQNLSFRPPRRYRPRRRSWRRRYRRNKRYRRYSRRGKGMALDGLLKEKAEAPAAPPPPPKPEPQAAAAARVAEFAASYALPGKVTVPSTGTPRKVAVAVVPMEVGLEYQAVPRLRAGAFLIAKGTYRGEVPLLPGRVSIFLGKDYVGRTRLKFLSSGAKLRMSFGRDDRLRVKRRRVAYKVNTQGVFTKEYKVDYRWRFDVENLVGRPVELALLDRVPVSMDERIKVEVHDETSPRAPLRADDAKGTMRFAVKLPRAGKQTLRLGYSVIYPRKLQISGLE